MRVIMFSGGLDSLVSALKIQDRGNDFKLFSVDMGFNHQEISKAKLLVEKFNWWDKWVLFKDNGIMEKFLERENNNFIPYRNFQFVIWADVYFRKESSEDIIYYLGGLKEDLIEDNTEFGRYEMGRCLNALNDSDRMVCVSSNIADNSKPDLVRWLLTKYPIEEVMDIIKISSSCYVGDNCGECNACLRKYFALKSAKFGMNWEVIFKKDPRESIVIQKYVERIKSGISASKMEEGRFIYTQKVLERLELI